MVTFLCIKKFTSVLRHVNKDIVLVIVKLVHATRYDDVVWERSRFVVDMQHMSAIDLARARINLNKLQPKHKLKNVHKATVYNQKKLYNRK